VDTGDVNELLNDITNSKFRAISSDCSVGRSLIITQDGYIGVAPNTVKAGDHIVALAGGYSLILLRRSLRDSSRYHLLGSCYLQGFMWLEAFLGPLPENHRYVARHTPGENYVSFEVLDLTTGLFKAGDPRVELGPLQENT
jgi:hypothetical protein